MIVKMTHDPGKRGETETKKIQEIFNKELEDLKAEMNNTISEMKNALEKNQQQDKWVKRMNKWAERQIGGNQLWKIIKINVWKEIKTD